MLPNMPTKRSPRKDSKKQGRQGEPVTIWLPDDIAAALEQLKDRDKRTKTVEIVQALRRHLAKKGFGEWLEEEEEREYR